MKKKIAVILVAFMVLCSAFATSLVSATGLVIEAPDTATAGETVTITVKQNGEPVEGAFVQFILNDGEPIFAETDTGGQAKFMPLIIGKLDVIATYLEARATKTISVTTPVSVGPVVNDTTTISGNVSIKTNVTIREGNVTLVTTTPEYAENLAKQINETNVVVIDIGGGATLEIQGVTNVTHVNETVTFDKTAETIYGSIFHGFLSLMEM